jgi:hypothetical protein
LEPAEDQENGSCRSGVGAFVGVWGAFHLIRSLGRMSGGHVVIGTGYRESGPGISG